MQDSGSYRCQILDHIKGNKSSMYRNNMACRLCTSGEDVTPKHLERINFTKGMRENLDLNIMEDKIMLWRRITRALKDIYDPKKDVVNENTPNHVPSTKYH